MKLIRQCALLMILTAFGVAASQVRVVSSARAESELSTLRLGGSCDKLVENTKILLPWCLQGQPRRLKQELGRHNSGNTVLVARSHWPQLQLQKLSESGTVDVVYGRGVAKRLEYFV